MAADGKYTVTTLPRPDLFNRELGKWIEQAPENVPAGWQPPAEQAPEQEEEEPQEQQHHQHQWPQESGEYMPYQGGWPQW